MNIILILLIILLILMTIIGGTRGIQSFFTLILNFFTLFFMLILISAKIDPIKVTFIGSMFITAPITAQVRLSRRKKEAF